MSDDWLIADYWLLIAVVHTDGHGGPQADGGVERKLSGINRELKEMGPQADEVRIQVTINDDWLLIIDWWLMITEYWSCFFKTFVVGFL